MALFRQGKTYQNDLFLAQMEAAYQRRSTGQHVGLVRGRHLIDWVPTFRQWLCEDREDEALTLLVEIIEAAEQLAQIDGAAPPAEYTRQALAIYQRRGDKAGEQAVLARYIAACPPGIADPDLLLQWKTSQEQGEENP